MGCAFRFVVRKTIGLRDAAMGLAAMSCLFAGATTASAQIHPPPSETHPLDVDSGLLRHHGSTQAVVWSEAVSVPGATWLRLHFQTALLGEDPRMGGSSVLRMTSFLDGATQHHTAVTLRQWQNSSAYFNGDTVLLELIAAPNGRANRIIIESATAGIPDEGGIGSICGSTDDRVPSQDRRVSRSLPVGCTSWLINDRNGCFISAGHCFELGNTNVVEFNVPLSNSNGSINHPGPEDQYAVQSACVQETFVTIGNDWAYFGCFPNSETGLTPAQAQGEVFDLADTAPPVQGQDIRITGFGTMNSPREWNQAQKTHVGPYSSLSGSAVRYRTDTTGGNSGSPVIDETTGQAIGVHTNGGCTSGGGTNSGTAVNNAGWQAALANPCGICAAGLLFDYSSGRPLFVTPAGGSQLFVSITSEGGAELDTATPEFHYDLGEGKITVPMTNVFENLYVAAFPEVPCGGLVQYYLSAETTDGTLFNDPPDAPGSTFNALGGLGAIVVFADDFENDLGWTVENVDLAAGAWERGVPIGGGANGDPADDYDGSGQCYLTENAAGNSDVDGGPTRLISPMFSVDGTDGFVRYARWFTNDVQDQDALVVEISNNGGADWVLVETVADGPTWLASEFLISNVVSPSAQMRVRFSVADNPNNSVTEAALDAFEVLIPDCNTPFDPGDLNCDGSVDGADIDAFFLALGDPVAYAATYPDCDADNADMNGDNAVDGGDIDPFFDCLGFGICP